MPPDRVQLATPTLMRAARGTYARSIRAQLREVGADDLPRNGAFILFGLLSGDGTRKDLPSGLGVSKQAVSQVIDVMVTRGYLERHRDAADRRRVSLEVTERGHEVLAAVVRGTETIDQQLASRMSAGEIVSMRSGLMALADIKTETTAAGVAARRPSRQFRRFSPIFPVRDLTAALAHYASLGFETVAYEGGADYGFANRDGIGLHFALDPEHDRAHGGGSTYLYIRDADALFDEWSKPGVGGVTRPVVPTPYGLREGSHTDPDGNLIRFGSREDAGD